MLLPLFAVLAIAAGTVLLVSLAQSVKLSLEKGETQSATHNRNKRQVGYPLLDQINNLGFVRTLSVGLGLVVLVCHAFYRL